MLQQIYQYVSAYSERVPEYRKIQTVKNRELKNSKYRKLHLNEQKI